MKLCAYLSYYHPELRIERALGQRHKPDLVRVGVDGVVHQWIDCGVTSLPKLCRITRQNPKTLIHIVKPSYRALCLYQELAAKRLRYPERVRYQSYQSGFLPALAEQMSAHLDWEVTVLEDDERPVHLYVQVGGTSLDTPLLWAGK